MSKELKELIELGQKYPELDKGELIRYVHLQSVLEYKLERLEEIETTICSVLREDISKKLKAMEVIKECFNLNGFDELVPNSKWFESKEKQDLLKEVLL